MLIRFLGGALLCAVLTLGVSAGDLNPPGAPAPTMLTLEDINSNLVSASGLLVSAQDPRAAITALPVTLEEPGAYYLRGDLTGVAGQSGIVIASSEITIDLNGFSLFGVPGSVNGIGITGFPRDVSILNGSITGWGGDGLRLHEEDIMGTTATVTGGHLRGVHLSGNGGMGARLGSDWTVSDCTSQGNGIAGFAGKYGNVFTRCTASDNDGAGFALSNSAGVISQCCARNNDGPGISLGDTAVITECTIHGNGEEGITSLNGQINVRGCHISANDGVGIDTSTSSSIEGCTVRENLGGGILVHSRCRVVGNTVTHNALVLDSEDAGIEVMGGNNRIDSNQLASNNIGIRCDAIPATDNIIIRNTVSGSTGDDFLVDDTDNLLAPVRTSFIGAGPWDNFTP